MLIRILEKKFFSLFYPIWIRFLTGFCTWWLTSGLSQLTFQQYQVGRRDNSGLAKPFGVYKIKKVTDILYK